RRVPRLSGASCLARSASRVRVLVLLRGECRETDGIKVDDLQHIAHALGGEVSGRQVLAPGPGHSSHDRSLAVRLAPNAPDGLLIYSHSGDDWRTCRDHVLSRLSITLSRALEL